MKEDINVTVRTWSCKIYGISEVLPKERVLGWRTGGEEVIGDRGGMRSPGRGNSRAQATLIGVTTYNKTNTYIIQILKLI